jgi:TRAP-type uncharacterized transport system fused permease subunit
VSKYLLATITLLTSVNVIVTLPQRIFGVGDVSTLDVVLGLCALVALLIAVKLTVDGASLLLPVCYCLCHLGTNLPRIPWSLRS